MALRIVLLVLGVLELLLPEELVDFWMNLAVEGDSDVELRQWVYTAARIEGLLIVLWALSLGRSRSAEE